MNRYEYESRKSSAAQSTKVPSSITLHKFGIVPDEDDCHVFTFIFENPFKLLEQKSVESSEVNYAGQRWSVVLMRKEEKYAGIYLKWKYSDGQSASCVTCRASFSLSMVHRMDYSRTKTFNSTQKFSSSQSLLGRGKFLALNELLDLGTGYLDETGKRVVVELSLSKCSTRFEKAVDTSPRARIKKNASGYYFDTNTFLLANNRWYLRVYPTKANSSGLPAVYLYLQSKSRGLSFQARFRLYVEGDSTDLLTNHFGEGSKFDGFGKTLSEALHKPDKIMELTIGVELNSITIYKNVGISLRKIGVYAPHVYNNYSYGSGSLASSESFQDQEGNLWKADIDNSAKIVTVTLDKGVHHYQTNKTKLLCWTATLLACTENGVDIPMCGEPLVGYFSNFIEESGYKMTFTMDTAELSSRCLQLEERGSPYVDGNGQLMVRIEILSLQTLPLGMKSLPRFDFQFKHLLRARRLLQEKERTLADLRDEAASRASLNFDSTRDFSETGSEHGGAYHMYKSFESLDGLGGNESIMNGHISQMDDTSSRTFITDLLQHLSSANEQGSPSADSPVTRRDVFNAAREDLSSESGITMSDETSVLVDARPSQVDVNKQKEVVTVLVRFLKQRLPLRVSEIVELGSLGTGTNTRSRTDVDLVVYSPELPRDGQPGWMPALMNAMRGLIAGASNYQDTFFPLPKCVDFCVTPAALQFTCGGVDVDIMASFDWDSDESGGMSNLYQLTSSAPNAMQLYWYSIGSSKLRKQFLSDQPNEVKEIIKVVKHWRNSIQWKRIHYRPPSYLLSLLVIKCVEDTQSTDMKTVLQRFGTLVLTPELSLSWDVFYNGADHPVDFDPPSPLVRDPANPGYNVASSLSYWGQFRTEVIHWLRGLGVTVCNIPTA